MTAINKERGEVAILLGGKPYPMRPSYEAMLEIESELGPLLALTTRLAHPTHRLTIKEMAFIVTAAVRAAGKERNDEMMTRYTVERVAELLYEDGVVKAIDAIELLLINMITGGSKAKKKGIEGET